MPFGITELTEAELAEAYAEGDVTYENIGTKTDSFFDKKVTKVEELVTTYTTLKSDIQSGEEKFLASQGELETLEDDYHAKSMAISEKFYELEDKRSEFESMIQETYEATSYSLRHDDLNEESFMSMNQIIDSFQMDFDTAYSVYQ